MQPKDSFLKKWGINIPMKQRYDTFVQKYLETGNSTQSYTFVFPNNKTPRDYGYKLLKKPYVVYQIQQKNKELEKISDKKILMNRERILKELEDILIATKDERPNTALKSLDQLAKILGAYAPIETINEHKGITINYINPEDKTKDKDKDKDK